MKIMNIILKIIPYFFSICGGIFVVWISHRYLHSEEWRDLMSNVAASLFSIPLVFIFYDYSNFLIKKRVNQHFKTELITELNKWIKKIITQTKGIVGVEDIVAFVRSFDINAATIHLNPKHIKTLANIVNKLEKILYKSERISVLSVQQIQNLSFLIQILNETINEYKYHNNKKELAKYFGTIVSTIDEWFEMLNNKILI